MVSFGFQESKKQHTWKMECAETESASDASERAEAAVRMVAGELTTVEKPMNIGHDTVHYIPEA